MARFSFTPELRGKLLRGFLYTSLFFASLLLFIYFTFPWERLITLGVQMAEDRAKMSIEIEGFAPSFGTGAGADKVTIQTKPAAGDKDGATYVLTDVSARISVFSLLLGDYKLSFEGELLGGHVDGEVALKSSNEKSIEMVLAEIDLAQISLISGYVGLPVAGRLGGDILLEIPAKGLRTANGAISLHIDGGKIGEKGAKLDPSKHGGRKTPGYDGSITLQEGAALGTFACNINIESGKGTIQEFGAAGGDVEASLEGSVLLRDAFVNSVLSGVLKFRFDEGYAERNKMSLFLTAPDLAQAKTDDGFFAFNINDPINRLKFKPSKREGIKPGARGITNPGLDAAVQVPRGAFAPALANPALPALQPPVVDPEPPPTKEPEKVEQPEEKKGEQPEEKKGEQPEEKKADPSPESDIKPRTAPEIQ